MLNWDEYGKEEKAAPPVTQNVNTEAPATEIKQKETPQPAESAVLDKPCNQDYSGSSRTHQAGHSQRGLVPD